MRYLLYTETFPSRVPDSPRQTGIGRYCYDLADGLRQLGHDVVVLTNDSVASPAGGAAPEPFAVELLGAPVRSRGQMVRRAAGVVRAVRERAPDVVMVGDPLANELYAVCADAARRPYCPIYYGTELAALAGRGGAALAPFARAAARLRTRYVARALLPVAISRYTAGLLRAAMPSSGEPCIVYPCVAEWLLRQPPRADARAALLGRTEGGSSDPFVLVTVARISERKNQLGVLRAVALLRARGVRVHYVIVGNVDAADHDGYYAELQRFIREHGLERSVTFVGNATDADKAERLDASDAFIMLSRPSGTSVEGFGISPIEGASRGKPALVSSHGGMPETVIDGETGFVLDPDDTAAVAAAIEVLALDPALRARMGAAGREYTRRQFTPRAVAATLDGRIAAALRSEAGCSPERPTPLTVERAARAQEP